MLGKKEKEKKKKKQDGKIQKHDLAAKPTNTVEKSHSVLCPPHTKTSSLHRFVRRSESGFISRLF